MNRKTLHAAISLVFCCSAESLSVGGGTTVTHTKFPKTTELLSAKDTVRRSAIGRFRAARRDLTRQLAAIVHPSTGMALSKAQRGSACFVLAEMRTPDAGAMAALIAAIDQNFFPNIMRDIPFGILNPSAALVRIGEPAVSPVMDALAVEAKSKRIDLLCETLKRIKGLDSSVLLLKNRLAVETDGTKRRRFRACLDLLLKQQKEKPRG